MRTEDYAIIIINAGVTDDKVSVKYNSNVPEDRASADITLEEQTINNFEALRPAENGTLEYPASDLGPGNYTVNLKIDGKVRSSKQFTIG